MVSKSSHVRARPSKKAFEDRTKEVEVFLCEDYAENAIQVMKKYCHTGANINRSPLPTQKSALVASELVELVGLANTYDSKLLYYGAVDSILCKIIGTCPWFATAAYDAAGSETKTLEACLVHFIMERSPDSIKSSFWVSWMRWIVVTPSDL